ncbi:MAG: hypothetical protein K8R77_11260 [Anaerolineaceae bacterium]|nr:hypothetical protein [Anaerolineaceae bacterium]
MKRKIANLAQWLQIWPQSPIAILNQVVYTLLGVSSILFGIAFTRKDPHRPPGYLAAWLLILNRATCILGLIGGALFLAGVAVLGFQYRRQTG